MSKFGLHKATMSSESPLSSLENMRTPSELGSEPTAHADETDLSSPADHEQPRLSTAYRGARQLPRELKEHCRIHLEEQLYQSALHTLSILHAAGGSRKSGVTKPAFVPPPAHLALLSTLTVHPQHTTRPTERTHVQVATQAHQLIQSLLRSVGPVRANMRTAFEFRTPRAGRGGGRRRRGVGFDRGGSTTPEEGVLDEGESDGEGTVGGRLAGEGSVWRRSPDFWSALGWAFNCAALHPARWRYWRAWVAQMVDVLEADWEERRRLDEEAQKAVGPTGDQAPEGGFEMLRDSLLMAYLERRRDGRGALRAVMRATFAEGSEADVAMYPEIFDRETAGPSRSRNKRKREPELDLGNDKFGDYLDDDSSASAGDEEMSQQPGVTTRRRDLKVPEPEADVFSEGMEESVPLRLRIFGLLVGASEMFPDDFVSLYDLYDSFSESVRNRPLPMFALLVSYNTPLSPDTYTSLLRQLLDKMLASGAPKPGSVDPDADRRDGVSAALLQHCFLPCAANNNTAVSNAKLSLLLEEMMRWVWTIGGLPYSAELRDAVERGVQARRDKALKRKKARTNVDPEEQAARDVLADSTRGLLDLLDVIEDVGGSDGEGGVEFELCCGH